MERLRRPAEFKSKPSWVPSPRVVGVREVPNLIPPLGPNGRPTFTNTAAWHQNQHLVLGHPSTNHPFEMAPPPFPAYKMLDRHCKPRPPPPLHFLQTPLNPSNHPTEAVGQDTQTMQQLNLPENPFYDIEPTSLETPCYWQDEMTWVPQMPSNFDPLSLMQYELRKKEKAPMYSVYDLPFQRRGLTSDSYLRIQNPTLGGPTSPSPSNMPSLGGALASAAPTKTPSLCQDGMTLVPQMPSNFDPSSLMQSEPRKEGKAPMYSVYDPSFQWIDFPNDPHFGSYNPTMSSPTSPGSYNISSLDNAYPSAFPLKEMAGTSRISKPTFMKGNRIQNQKKN